MHNTMTPDYRDSHLEKGAIYDEALATNGLDSYLDLQERRILATAVIPRFVKPNARYLDFACGTGRITQQVEPFVDASFAVDVSQTMIDRAREKCRKTTFYITDITREESPIAPVNLATAFRFFGNAQDGLRRAVLQSLRRLVVPGGYLIVNNHRNPWAIANLISKVRGQRHGMDLSPPKLTRLLAEADFRIVATYGIGLWMVRSRFHERDAVASPVASKLERLSCLPGVSGFCQDAIIVARRDAVGSQ